MDPISIALAGGGLLGGLVQGQQAKNQARQNQEMQQALADEQLRFAKSARTDAYGNRVYYDNATGEWKTDLSPEQQRISSASQAEQLHGLTADAQQNRAVRDAAFQRGRRAGDAYDRASAGYQYGAGPSEGAIEDQLQRLLVTSKFGAGSTAPVGNIRTTGNLPFVRSGPSTPGADNLSSLADTLVKARSGALNEFGQRASTNASKYLPAIQQYGRDASGGGGAPINFDTEPDKLRSTEDSASKGLLGASQNIDKNLGAASNQLTTAIGKQFPTGDMFKALSAYGKGGTAGKTNMGTSTDMTANQGYYGGSPETNYWLNPDTYSYGSA